MLFGMTMLSFRVDDSMEAELTEWAETTGSDRSSLLREALRRHLARLAAQRDAEIYERQPWTDDELAVGRIAAWGPAEDWSDWADAAG